MSDAEEYLKKVANDSIPEFATFTYKEVREAVRLARKEGYKQAQDDYDIVTENDKSFKKLSKIFDKPNKKELSLKPQSDDKKVNE